MTDGSPASGFMLRLNVTVAWTRPVPNELSDLTGSRICVVLGLPAMAMVAEGFCVATNLVTVTPPESWPMGPVPWPHQLFSALAPAGAVTPTFVAKSFSLTTSPESPVTPPDWMLEHWSVVGAPMVFTAEPGLFGKTFGSRSAWAFWRLTATPPIGSKLFFVVHPV